MAKMTIEDKLGVNKFHTDELNSHIDVDKECQDTEAVNLIIQACPAGLYKRDENGQLLFDHLGCLECGTCRVLGHQSLIRDWSYPVGTKGIEYRMG